MTVQVLVILDEYMREELIKYENINCNYTELYDNFVVPRKIKIVIIVMTIRRPRSDIDLRDAINNGASLLLYVGHANEVILSTTKFSVNNSQN